MKNIRKALLASLILVSSFCQVCPGEEPPVRRFAVTAGANLFRNTQASYRQLYGQSAFMPEIKIAWSFYHDIGIWGGCSSISGNGFIEEVNEEVQIARFFLGFGLGYVQKLNASMRIRAELGLTFNSFKEEALGAIRKGSGLGWKIGATLDYFFSKRVFVFLTSAFSQAGDQAQTGKIELGGFQAGTGLGFAF